MIYGTRPKADDLVKGAIEELGRIETIKNTVPADRLIVWELGVDGWGRSARRWAWTFPDKPFPHLHDTNEFRTEFGLQPLPA